MTTDQTDRAHHSRGSCDSCGETRELTTVMAFGCEGDFCGPCRGQGDECARCGDEYDPGPLGEVNCWRCVTEVNL